MSDKRVSEMSDGEIRALAGAADPLAAELAAIKERSEHPLGPISNDAVRYLMESAEDVPRLLGALEAVLARVGLWEKYAATFPHIDREDAAEQIRLAISAALLGKEATDA
jgi:hypothetical protein